MGKLWFSIGLNDETDKDYDKIKKKIEEKLKEKIEVKIRPSVDAEQFKRTMEDAFNKVNSGSFSRGIDLAVKGVDQLNTSAEKLAKALERIKDLVEELGVRDCQMNLGIWRRSLARCTA